MLQGPTPIYSSLDSREGGSNVADLADEPADAGAWARMKAAVFVEGRGLVVNGVDGEIPASDAVAGGYRPAQSIKKELCPQPLAMQLPV